LSGESGARVELGTVPVPQIRSPVARAFDLNGGVRVFLVSDTAEIIKAVPELMKAISWPIAIGVIVWILREPFRTLIEKVEKITIGHGDTKAEIEIAQEIAKVAPLDNEQTRTLIRSIKAETETVPVVHPRKDPQKEEALRASTGNDLKSLETLIAVAEKVPRAAIEASWEILSKSVIETAKVFGFRRREEGDSELRQAVFHLTVVLGSQDFMIDVYALRTALQKVENAPNADISAKDAQNFVRACIAVLGRFFSILNSFHLPTTLEEVTRPAAAANVVPMMA
jgi:hypothetical protein